MLKIKLAKTVSVHVKADLWLIGVVREHAVLGRSLGLNSDNVAVGCRQLNSDSRHDLYGFAYGMPVGTIKWRGISHREKTVDEQKIAVGVCEGLRPLVRPRHSLEDGITDISQRNMALERATDSCGSEQTPVAGSCDFLEQLASQELL